ncbi:hypothetical protein DFJ74DRAFT_688638 [Hyaloraphidium curvatum]|nr:hypothetical protein DFJ74DRAFT_688638 [Hyaloraphidium curvatum]
MSHGGAQGLRGRGSRVGAADLALPRSLRAAMSTTRKGGKGKGPKGERTITTDSLGPGLDLHSFILGKLAKHDAGVVAFRDPPPSGMQLTLGEVRDKSTTFAGAMRKFGVGTALVKGKPPRIGVWGGEFSPCKFAICCLGIIKAGGVPVLLPPSVPSEEAFKALGLSLLILHSSFLPSLPESTISLTNVIVLELEADANTTGLIDVWECCESRTTTRWHSDGDAEKEVEKGDGYILASWDGPETALTSGEIVKGLGEWADRAKAGPALTSSKAFSDPEGLAAFHAAIFHRKLLQLDHPVPSASGSADEDEDDEDED